MFENKFFNRSNLKGALLIAFIFFIIELILVCFHEPWGDEIHSWAIAGNSHSFTDLVYNTRYEGHPKIWYFLLFILQKFTSNIFFMQVLHVCIATCTVFVFCFFSPFSFLRNILFCFGYFFAYEYSIISRNYAIEVLLLFLCLGLYSKNSNKYLLLISVLFFLLFQTNVFAVIIGFPFYCYIIWNIFNSFYSKRRLIYISVATVLIGVFISAISMKPPSNSAFSSWGTEINFLQFVKVLSNLFYSYFPFPQFRNQFWCTNILDTLPNPFYVQSFLSVLILIGLIIFFRKNKSILYLFCTGTFGVLLFMYTKYGGGLRHPGHLFLLFILCYWLFTNDKTNDQKKSSNSTSDKVNLLLEKYFITAILIVQFAASCYANIADLKYVFSNDKPVANYLKENKLDSLPILGDADYAVSGIAGVLGKEIYFMRPKYWGNYITLDSNWGNFIPFSINDLLKQVDSISGQNKQDVIVILSNRINIDLFKNWTLLRTFTKSIVGEDFDIYKVVYIEPSPFKLNTNGELLLQKGYMKEAMGLFIKALKLKPDYGLAYMNLANCYNNGTGDFNKANKYIDSAIKYAPNDVNVIYDKGAILFNSGNHVSALNYFIKTLEKNPKFLSAYISVARCYISLKDDDNAIRYLKKSLEIDTTNSNTYQLLAQCYKGKGNIVQENFYSTKASRLAE